MLIICCFKDSSIIFFLSSISFLRFSLSLSFFSLSSSSFCSAKYCSSALDGFYGEIILGGDSTFGFGGSGETGLMITGGFEISGAGIVFCSLFLFSFSYILFSLLVLGEGLLYSISIYSGSGVAGFSGENTFATIGVGALIGDSGGVMDFGVSSFGDSL